MRTIFSSESFGRQAFVPFRLAQAPQQTAFNVFGELLSAVGISEDDLNKLLEKIPSNLVGQYQAKLDACKAKGAATPEGAACLYALYQEMKAAGDKPATAPPPPPAPASTFPVVPVAIGGLLLAGLVVFLATRKG